MILYPTETVYGLGVNALDPEALKKLYDFKGRDTKKSVSWLVRDMNDVMRYAIVSKKAEKIAERFLPGPLTLVLPARTDISAEVISDDQMIAFRISKDLLASALITEYMKEHNAPLTCTSANVSGMPTCETPEEILLQFGPKAVEIDRIIDGGERKGVPSTVVCIHEGDVEILREGSISKSDILSI